MRGALVLLALTLAMPMADAAGLPFVAGQSWVHRIRSGDGSSYESRTSVVDVREFPGTDASAAHVEIRYGDNLTDLWYSQWYRLSDGASLRFRNEHGGNTTDEAVPCGAYVWPLVVGTDATTRCDDGSTRAFRVEAKENVTVPAGTFEAYRINRSGPDRVQLEWFAPSACIWVKNTFTIPPGAPTVVELVRGGCEAPQARASPGFVPLAVASSFVVAALLARRWRRSDEPTPGALAFWRGSKRS